VPDFSKEEPHFASPGGNLRPATDIYFHYGLKIIITSPAKYNQSIGLNWEKWIFSI